MAGESDEPDTLPGSVDEMTRGVDSVLGREVAMVSLPPARGEALTVRTEHVRRLAALHHPNLIEVYDVDGLAEDTESTLVLQSVDGHSLDAVVESAPWPAVSVAHVGAQVADGLAHAHAHGVLHGGIGPASLVVDETLHAWLTGFTAALRPAPTATPTAADGGPAVSSPTEDVVALGAALRALLDMSIAVPAVLDDALRAMTAGRCDARTAASALTDAAETCAHGDAAGGVVPMAVYSARISTSRSGTPDVTGPASGPTPSSGSGPASPSVPSPVPAAAAAAAAAAVAAQQAAGPARPTSPPAGSLTPITAASSARRSGRQAHRGLRVAALGAATMAVAVASSAVLWAANSFSAPLPAPTGAAQGSPAVVADPALGQVTAPPAGVDTGVAVPGDARPPLLDVSTLGANEESPSRVAATSDRAVDTAPSGGSWFEHGPPVHEPPDRWYPPYRPPWVPPRPTTTAPPSTTTTVPPTTTTTPKPTTTTPKPTTTTPKPTTTTPKPTTTKPTTTTKSTGTSGQGVAGQGSGAAQGAGEAATGTGDAAPGASGAGVAPSARAAGPVSPTPAVVAAGR